MQHTTKWGQLVLTYDSDDQSLTAEAPKGTRTFTADEMRCVARDFEGANRIHKPVGLLFWTDCRNGCASNWRGD